MQKILFSFLVFFLGIQVQGQNMSKWSIGINFSPTYSYRTLINHDGQDYLNTFISNRNSNEAFSLNFSSGLKLKRELNSVFSLESGIQYQMQGYRTKENSLRFGSNPQGNSNSSVWVKYQYTSFAVPLRLIYTGKGERRRFIASLGTLYSFAHQWNQFMYVRDANGRAVSTSKDNMSEFYTFQKHILYFTASAGIECSLSNRLQLQIEPTLVYGLTTSIKAPVYEKLWTVGLNLQCNYKLGISN